MRRFALLFAAGCAPSTTVEILELEHNRLAVILAVTAENPVHAQGRCTADDDGEARILPRQGPDLLLDLPLAGLRADTTWTCAVQVDDGKKARDFEVPVEPELPLGVGGYGVEGATDPAGYTLITEWDHGRSHPNIRSTIVDPQGRARWYRFTDHAVVAGLDSALTPGGLVLTGGGPDQAPTWYNALGDKVAELGEPPIAGAYHHHAEPYEGGVLTLVEVQNTRADASAFTGFAIVLYDAAGQPAWTWNSQSAVDAGSVFVAGGQDPFHANSVSLVDDALGPAAWVSLYRTGHLIRIDRTSGLVTHNLGALGDFALQDPTGAPLPDDQWFSGQHDPEFDGPKVLLYDNNRDHKQSRALELELDLTAATATVLWQWTEPDWYEPIFGDADRIADDRVLITRGRCWLECQDMRAVDERISDIVEVDREGVVQHRLIGPDSNRGMYRAERIDPCLLWDDPALCP